MSIPLKPEALREALSFSVDALHRRRANEIPEPTIDLLVGMDWLEWHGGNLRLTTTGHNIYRHELAQSRANSSAAIQDRPAAQSIRRP